jgi:hypothetical protein
MGLRAHPQAGRRRQNFVGAIATFVVEERVIK